MMSEFQSAQSDELHSIDANRLAVPALSKPLAKEMIEPDSLGHTKHTLPDGSTVTKNDDGAIVFCRFASGIGMRRYPSMVLLERPGHDFVVNISNKAWMQWD